MGGRILPIFLFLAAISLVEGDIVCATCSDRIIRWNWDMMPYVRVPVDWPSCNGSGVSGKETNTPILLSRCEHSCISIDWIHLTKGEKVFYRFRGCSTGLLRGSEAEHANSKATQLLTIYEARRYKLEIHPKLCYSELCNFDSDIYHEALWPTVAPEDLSSEETMSSEEDTTTPSTDSASVPEGATTSTEKYLKHRYYTVPTDTSFEDDLMDVLSDYDAQILVDQNDLKTKASPTVDTESPELLKTLFSNLDSAKQPATIISATFIVLHDNNTEAGMNETVEIFTKVEEHLDRITPNWAFGGNPEHVNNSCGLPMISLLAAAILLI